MKSKGLKITKLKEERLQGEINNFQRNLSGIIIRNDNMNEEIPSLLLSSTCDEALIHNLEKPSSYIVYPDDKYSKGRQERKKMKDTEPFCLFRYQDSAYDGEKES